MEEEPMDRLEAVSRPTFGSTVTAIFPTVPAPDTKARRDRFGNLS
jgi:hypothetical protein